MPWEEIERRHLRAFPPPQGEIIDDCIDRAGVPACRTEAGAWRPCAASGEQEAAQLGALGDELAVADRQTVNGEECLLPVVLR